jgi:plasmid stabilization system protein ParE
MAGLRETMKGLVGGTVVSRERNDLKPGLRMTASGGHCVETNESHVLVLRVLHDKMDYPRHLEGDGTTNE